MTIDRVRSALQSLEDFTETPSGVRVATHCLYPSFETVLVYVVAVGDGYRVHDGGHSLVNAWDHGRDLNVSEKYFKREARRYGLTFDKGVFTGKVESLDWLPNAVLSVANAASGAAAQAVGHAVRAATANLKTRIYDALGDAIRGYQIAKEFAYIGESGKEHHFDFAVTDKKEGLILIDAVAPHHSSISARYVSFSDAKHVRRSRRLAVHDRHLAASDKALLTQVADVVPLKSVRLGVERALRLIERN